MASLIFQEILKEVTPEQRAKVRLSLALAARIHELMDKYSLDASIIAEKMKEPIETIEIWISGTHTFSVDTLVGLECLFGEPIIRVEASLGKVMTTRTN